MSVMMSHSAATQKLIYAANKGAGEALEAFRAMEDLRGTEGMVSPKKRLSTPEVEDMKLYFDSNITV